MMDKHILHGFQSMNKKYTGKVKEVKFNKKLFFVTLDYYDEEDILSEEFTFTMAQILTNFLLLCLDITVKPLLRNTVVLAAHVLSECDTVASFYGITQST